MGTNGGTFVATTVNGWDGETGSAPIASPLPLVRRGSATSAFGGNGTDTLDMVASLGGEPSYSVFSARPNSNHLPTFLAGVEIIVAGAAADVINLTFNDGVTRTAYGENVSIFAGCRRRHRVLRLGRRRDRRRRQSGTEAAMPATTLYGGQGRDTIFGDDFNADSAFGGDDRLFGGGGNDTSLAASATTRSMAATAWTCFTAARATTSCAILDAGDLNGDDGGDLLVLQVTSIGVELLRQWRQGRCFGRRRSGVRGRHLQQHQPAAWAPATIYSSPATSTAARLQTDRVFGETASDVISSWYGNDRSTVATAATRCGAAPVSTPSWAAPTATSSMAAPATAIC